MSHRVASIIVTRDRRAVVERAIRAVLEQQRPPDGVFVVDNASSDDTPVALGGRRDLTYIRSEDNGGYAAGLAIGIDAARAEGYDAYWLMDDDSVPDPTTLGRLESAAGSVGPKAGLIGLRGGLLRSGRVRHLRDRASLAERPAAAPDAFEVDFSLVDGALLLEPAATIAGAFRGDFFMMFEDIEYCWRIRRAGFLVVVLAQETITRDHLGSTPGVGGVSWRRFYLARNQLRWALDARSPRLVLGTLVRLATLAASSAKHRRWDGVTLTGRGIAAGVRGEMGRTLEPPKARSPEGGDVDR